MQTLTAGGGLQNLGNTCFFNATLQSLLHTPPLARLFQNHTHSQQCGQKEWCVFCQMESIFNKTRQGKSFSPNNMIMNLKKIFKKFKLGRQEDSHEFLRYLVQGMQDSQTGKLGKDRKENEEKIKKTKVFDVFGGVIKTCVECLSCSHKSITEERYYDFNIECQRASSLLEGVSSFFQVDKLEGANKYLCENCKVRSNARKRAILDSIPQVATFQLKRFTNNMRKIGKFIQYPLEIDLGKYLQNPRKVTLKLFAIIVHAGGSSFSGHYYAFVRVGNAWFKMDDSYVSKCSYESVMAQNAYILFYEKQQHTEMKQMNGNHKKEKTNKVEIQILNKNDVKVKEIQNVFDKHLQQKKQLQRTMDSQQPVHINGFNKLHINGEKQNGHIKELNGVLHKDKHSENIAGKDLAQIQHILIEKLTSSQVFKGINEPQNHINEAIQKAVKQAIQQATPKKLPEQQKPDQENGQLGLSIPSLQRRKSKQQMEHQIPYSQLILRTFQKILQLKSKMPTHRPHNFSQRSMYNLRKYETTMQKKRKLG